MYKVYCAAFFAIIIIPFSSINAQEKEEYKYALQFQIGPNFTLRSFQGEVLSGKYNFDKKNSFRLGISFNNLDQEENILGHEGSEIISSVRRNSGTSITINFQYLRNNYWDAFNFYFGGGPLILYSFEKNESEDASRFAGTHLKQMDMD